VASTRWRIAGLLLATCAGLCLIAVLAIGVLLIGIGSSACFDASDAACDAGQGLSAVRPSSWLIGGVGFVATLTAAVIALRLQRRAQIFVVIALLMLPIVGAALLWARL
jgi:hypothetical protein